MTATPTPDDGALAACPFCGGTFKAHGFGGTGHKENCFFLVRERQPVTRTRDTIAQHEAECNAAWNTRSPAPVSGEAARVKELEGVLRYIIEYGERSGLKRVQQVCDMTLKGMDMSPLRQEPTQHCAGAGREGG